MRITIRKMSMKKAHRVAIPLTGRLPGGLWIILLNWKVYQLIHSIISFSDFSK